jgi:hypothetical protein
VTIPKWDVPCFFNINKVWTLFQYAVSKDNAELAAHLHKLGCNVDARDQTGNTALHIAAKKQLPVHRPPPSPQPIEDDNVMID